MILPVASSSDNPANSTLTKIELYTLAGDIFATNSFKKYNVV